MKNLRSFRVKKIIALVLVMCLGFALTACTTSSSSSSSAKLEVSSEEQNPEMSSYTNDFDGIVSYLKDSEVLAGDASEMAADFIGAVNGGKFSFSYEGTSITCEIYEYDLDNLNEKAEETIASVKENGTFRSLNEDVEATLSNSGKFLMIYKNSASSKDDTQKAMAERMNDKFTNFVGK